MSHELPLPAYAVVYRQTADGRWKAGVVDVPGLTAEGADIDEVKDRISAKGRAYFAQVGRDGVAESTTVVGYIHIDGVADREDRPNKTTLF